MDGNEEVTAHMLYVSRGGAWLPYTPPRHRREFYDMLWRKQSRRLPQSDKSMKSTATTTFGTIRIFWLRLRGDAQGRAVVLSAPFDYAQGMLFGE
jgi:hypothetical protein